MAANYAYLIVVLFTIGCQFDNNAEHSVERQYFHDDFFDNGKLKSRVWYNDDLKEDSLGLWFYENGNLKVKAHFSNGKQVGSTCYYYPNGSIESYYFYNSVGDGSAMFAQRFSQKGELIEEKGMPIGIIYENGLTINSGNYLDFTVVSVKPPNSEMTIRTFSKENTPDFVLGTTYLVNDKMPLFRHYFETKGAYPMRVISELKDTARNVIRLDTVNFIVSVE